MTERGRKCGNEDERPKRNMGKYIYSKQMEEEMTGKGRCGKEWEENMRTGRK